MIAASDIFKAAILIVDDNKVNILLLQRMLLEAGYLSVDSTRNPREVCDLHRKNHYDLILLDLQMPVMDGFQVMEGLKQIETSGYLPVLVITAQPGHKLRALQSGAKDFVSKPFDLPEVLMRVHNMLEVRLLQTETRRLYDQVLAEQRISNQRLHVFRSGPVAVSISTLFQGRIIDANDAYCSFFKYSRDEVIGTTVLKLNIWVNSVDRDCVMARLLKERTVHGFETQMRRKSGEVRDVYASLELIDLLEEAEPALILMVTDITDRKRAEIALMESEERYHDILEHANDFILSVSPGGKLLYANHAWHETIGYRMEELDDLKLLDLVPPEGREQPSRLFTEAAEGKEIPLIEAEFVSKENRRIIVEGSVSAKSENGRVVSLRCIFRDVTEKKQVEAQLLRTQRMESIGTLAGGIAHDLNNMLTPILLAIEVLQKNITDNTDLNILEMLRKSAEHGADMVRQVLTFSRGGDGRKSNVSAKQLIQEIVGIVNHTFPKSILVRDDVPDDLWTVVGDDTQLHQVLLNLCVNARDAMPGGGSLSINTRNVDLDDNFVRMNNPAGEPGHYVLIQISDTGTGIAPKTLERMFEPFFTTKPLTKGTGLGLSTVRGIVMGHRGFVCVESEIGRGSSFNVYLPSTAPNHTRSSTVVCEPPVVGNGELVLVVDDEETILNVTRQSLEVFGYRVLVARGGAQAVALCGEHRGSIKVLITDMMMPEMDGVATIKAVRGIDPSIKIIGVSGLWGENRIESPETIGANAFVPKPYTSTSLLSALSRVLAGQVSTPQMITVSSPTV